MSDLLQYAPITPSIVRSLTDKLYEKRKAAALEIEKQVREYVKLNDSAELEKIISVLEMLTLNPNTNSRKGGLIGLAATTIALGKSSSSYSSKLMEPVFLCFTDADPRVRYFACESLYNIIKICRTSALTKFGKLFDILWKLTSDSDQNVRSGSELLDRLIKEIVVGTPNFDLEYLMVLICERIYTVNSSNRRFIISWLNTALTVPMFSVNNYIPEVVDGVFKALEDPSQAVRDITISVLTELLYKLDGKSENDANIGAIVNIMVVHANSNNMISREMGIVWLNEICKSYNSRVLPNLSSFFIAILPFIGDILYKADELNQRLMDLVKSDSEIPIEAVVEVLLAHLRHDKTECKVATLNWVRHLHSVQQTKMFCHIDRFFPVFLELLLDSADEVLMLDIMLISDICGQSKHNLELTTLNLSDDVNEELKSVSPYLIKFNISLLKMFKNEPSLMAERGVQILRQICLLLNPADVYRSLAVLLLSFQSFDQMMDKRQINSPTLPIIEQLKDSGSLPLLINDNTDEFEFISKMIAMLNRILLTTFELFHLRQCLRNPEKNECVDLFERLFRCWCHQPICLISLCLLSRNYNQAVEIVHRLSDFDVTVGLLTEIDHLVQLLESPIFSYVRMDLLNCNHQKPLAGVLSALLMILPQTDAFNTLHKRLLSVPNLVVLEKKSELNVLPTSTVLTSKIKFKDLINYFDKVTNYRNHFIRKNHQKLLDSMYRLK